MNNNLKMIKNWDSKDIKGFFNFIEEIWDHQYGSFEKKAMEYILITGGWSYNEEIIMAMSDNAAIWALTWQLSRRGGYFYFSSKI